MIVLSNDERQKFSQWLRQEALASNNIIHMLVSINAPEALIKMKRSEMDSMIIIANVIDKTETMTI